MLHKKYFRLALAILLATALTVGVVGQVAALEIRGGEGTVTIAQNEVIDDDLLVGAQNVVVDGTINGDLIVGGTNVTINGTVNGSLIMGGQVLNLNGKVAGTVYSGGTSLTIGPKAEIGRNLFYGGFSLTAEDGSLIKRDALVAGYQFVLGGEVGRDARVSAGALEINGKVGGDVIAEVGNPADVGQTSFMPFVVPGAPPMVQPGLRVGPEATIGGKLTYTSQVEQPGAIRAQPGGGIAFQTPMPGTQPQPAPDPRVTFIANFWGWFRGLAGEFMALILLGALVVWKLPRLLSTTMDKARTQTLPALGWGVIVILLGFLVVIAAAIVIGLIGAIIWVITLGELSGSVFSLGFSALGVAFAIFWLLVSYGSKIVVAYLVGKLLVQAVAPQVAENKFVLLLVGIVLYMIIRAIPLLGWLVGLVAILIGVGAMWLVYRDWRTKFAPPRPAPMPTPAPAAA
jgi:cytoskeletal protein CcmA (bactofilin family)